MKINNFGITRERIEILIALIIIELLSPRFSFIHHSYT